MFLGLFRTKVKVVTVKRKKKAKKAVKPKVKRPKIKKPKIRKRISGLKKRKPVTKKVRKLKKTSRPKVVMPQIVGKITHYFPHVKAGVILVTNGVISLGDTLHIKGHTTDFKQKVNSMQINNVPINKAKPGEEIGLLIKSRARHNDVVYKL